MALLAYNKTAGSLALAAGSPIVTLVAAPSTGALSTANDVTAELRPNLTVDPINGIAGGLDAAAFVLLQAQVAPQTGTGDSFAISGSDVTLTDAAGTFTDANIGQFISIGGATTLTNNGTFLVTARTATTITFTNALGVAEAYAGTYTLPPKVEYRWSAGVPEYNTSALFVASESLVSENVHTFGDVSLGSDLNPGTQAAPVQTIGKVIDIMVKDAWRKANVARLSAGTYSWSQLSGAQGLARPAGRDSTPPVIVGAYSTVFGPATVTAVNADGSVDVPGITALVTGTGDSFAFSSPTVTLTDAAAGFVAAGVEPGMKVTIAGSTSPANDGTFLITAVTATTLAFHNPAGVAEAYAGSYDVTVDRFFGVPRMMVIAGPGAGRARMCAGNTATALLPHAPITGVAAGSVVVLETPSTFISCTGGFSIGRGTQLGLIGIHLTTTGGIFLVEGCFVQGEGCIFDLSNASLPFLMAQYVNVRGPSSSWNGAGSFNPFDATNRTNGILVKGNQANSLSLSEFSFLNQSMMYKNIEVNCSRNSVVQHGSVHTRNVSFTVQGSHLQLFGSSAASLNTFQGGRSGIPYVFGFFDDAQGNLDRAAVTNVAGNPIQCGRDIAVAANAIGRGGGRANIGNVSGSTNNTGVGIKYTKGSNVVIDYSGTNTTVTGVGGDTEGRRPTTDTQTYATVRTADGSGIKGYSDPYGNRIEPPA